MNLRGAYVSKHDRTSTPLAITVQKLVAHIFFVPTSAKRS